MTITRPFEHPINGTSSFDSPGGHSGTDTGGGMLPPFSDFKTGHLFCWAKMAELDFSMVSVVEFRGSATRKGWGGGTVPFTPPGVWGPLVRLSAARREAVICPRGVPAAGACSVFNSARVSRGWNCFAVSCVACLPDVGARLGLRAKEKAAASV